MPKFGRFSIWSRLEKSDFLPEQGGKSELPAMSGLFSDWQ
jgi:hypothetical protein